MMKYVDVYMDRKGRILIISPSKSTLKAIKNINNGKVIQQTLLQRLKDIYKVSPSAKLDGAIETLERRKYYEDSRKRQERKKGKIEGNSTAFEKVFYIDINYRSKEKEIEKHLTPEEKDKYWFNLIKLQMYEPLNKKYKDHALIDKSIDSITYSQNLVDYRSFCIRTDVGFIKRLRNNKEAKSNAIICLYKRDENNKIYLCNIGYHDEVYNYSVDDYIFTENK